MNFDFKKLGKMVRCPYRTKRLEVGADPCHDPIQEFKKKRILYLFNFDSYGQPRIKHENARRRSEFLLSS